MTDTKTESKADTKAKSKSDAEPDAPDVREGEVDPPEPDIVLDTTNEDTTVGLLHRRHVDVVVPDYDDLNQVEEIASDPVDYFQVAGSPNGAVLSFNGAAYAFTASQVAALKVAVDHLIAGLSL